MKKKISLLLVGLLLCSMFFSGCQEKEVVLEEGKFYIFYLEQSGKKLYPVEAILTQSDSQDTQIESIWANMCQVPADVDYISAVPGYIQLNGHSVTNDVLTLDFGRTYLDLNSIAEVLLRAACVQTFTQMDGINYVQITINGQSLTKSDGTVVNAQSSGDFVDIVGKGINSYTRTTLTLYFANETGDHLVTETRDIAYNSDNSLEQYVVSKLIQGPAEDDSAASASIPPSTQILQINTTSDGVCHVNLSEEFVRDALDVEAYIPIYSIVNSLTSLQGVNSVLISVNGSSNILFKDQISLQQPLNRDLNYVVGQ